MGTLLIHLASVALLALAVEAACRLGRFRPAVCHALWLVVLVKLIVPPVVAWPLSAEALNVAYWGGSATVARAETAPREPFARVGLAEDDAAVVDAVAAPAMPSAVSPGVWLTPLLLGLWIAGGAAVAIQIAWRVRRVRRLVASGAPLPAWLQARLEAACGLLGVPVPRAIITGEPGAVYMQIAGTPTLVISADSLAHVAPAQWHTILTHELAHLKRRDHWAAWLVLAAGAVWWWNPCFWWVRHRIHLFSEMACDAWVIDVHPGDRKQYAETMVQLMAMISRQDASAPAMGLAAWSASTQERRLWMIMKSNGNGGVSRYHAVGLAAMAILVSPAWLAIGAEAAKPGEEQPAEAAGGWKLSLEPTEELKTLLESPVNIEFQDIHLKDCLEFVQDSFEVNVVLDVRAVAPEKKEGAESAAEGPLGGEPYVSDGMVPYINLKATPLKDALAAMIGPLNLTYQLRGDAVWISSAALIAGDQAVPLPSASFSDGEILDRLKSAVNIEFEEIHIQDVLQFLSDAFELNSVVDKRVVMPEGGDWTAPPLGSSGYVTDGMVGYINLKNCSTGEALYALTRMLGLTYKVHKDYVFISSPALVNSIPSAVPAAAK